MSGLQMGIALRHAGCHTPIVSMGAFATPELRRAVGGLGNAAFLDRPLEPAALAGAARAALARPIDHRG
jgi:FixJ family two-component response regulator